MEQLKRYALYETVFITGAAVLVIEVTAVRILTPFFGSSLFVLSSVLTIILAALSVGYWIGGNLSDRYPIHKPLFSLIAASGFSILIFLPLSKPVMFLVSESVSITIGPLIVAFLFFFVPALLLGIVSPYVIKLQSLSVPYEKIGSVIGATFFWGTVGSITGSLATGFFLIPQLGITRVMVGTGIVLVLLGLLGLFVLSERKSRLPIVGIIMLLLGIAINVPQIQAVENFVYQGEGLYSSILVYDIKLRGRQARLLRRDTNNSSGIFLQSFDLPFGYTQFSELYPVLKPDTSDFLLIGGGAYSIPRTLVARDEDIRVDVVEIEPVLYDIAKKYFGLENTARITNYAEDARVYLNKTDKKYDVIFADAFSTDLSVPFHLTTTEFFEGIREHLKDNGVLIMNTIGSFEIEPPSITGSIVKTLESVFPNTVVYVIPNPSSSSNIRNIMLIARNGDEPIQTGDEIIVLTGGLELTVSELMKKPESLNLADELLFTDDHAPVEYLMTKYLSQ